MKKIVLLITKEPPIMPHVNYTPISLVGINAKITHNILASRVQSCIKSITCSEQGRCVIMTTVFKYQEIHQKNPFQLQNNRKILRILSQGAERASDKVYQPLLIKIPGTIRIKTV